MATSPLNASSRYAVRPTRAPRPNLAQAARRDIRRAVSLATELGLHSVALHGVVWTIRHDVDTISDKIPVNRSQPVRAESAPAAAMSGRISRRESSKARLQHFQKATRHWLANIIKRWRRTTREAPEQLTETRPQQELEQMDLDARAKRTRSPASAPAPSPSERTPSAKRAIVLPADPPPPSNPPSPPSGGDTLPPFTDKEVASSQAASTEGDGASSSARTRSAERHQCYKCAGMFTPDRLDPRIGPRGTRMCVECVKQLRESG